MTYADTHEHLQDELERIGVLLRGRLSEWWDEDGGRTGSRYLSGTDVDAFLDPSGEAESGTGESGVRERMDEMAADIEERKHQAREDGVTLRLAELADRFDLSRRHQDVLLLALAPRIDRRYGEVYTYLFDDATMTRPTVDLVLRLLCDTADERFETGRLFAPSSPLREHALLEWSGGGVDPEDVVAVDRRVVAYLRGADELDPELASVAEVVDGGPTLEDLPLEESTREALAAVEPGRAGAATYYFHGPDGSGPVRAVEALAGGAGDALVRAPFRAVAEDPATFERLVREATLRDGALHLTGFDVDPDRRREPGPDASGAGSTERLGREAAMDRLDRFEGDVYLTGEDPWMPEGDPANHSFDVVAFPRPDYALREDLWADRAHVLPEDVDPSELAAKFEITQGQVDDAIAKARALEHDGDLTRESLYEGCKAQSGERLDELAEKIEPGYGWTDLVLPPDTENRLKEVAVRIKYRGTVYSDWGFGERFSRGKGVVALFTGPSGTGKTMSAEVLANYAGLDLYKIDLSSVVSKYIGETEENLEEIFDEAEHSNAILLFDEADAIFGERSEVSDSTDRYANVEVNYLLQRIERYDGVVLMTSNYDQNIDDAFQRRIHITIDFSRPGEFARQEIWRGMFPEDTPTGDIDFPFLAGFDLTGGNVENIALTAAFLAADDEGLVEMIHVVRALRRELQKTGRLVSADEFGEYGELLR
ncbi:AAA family ATPase [Halobacteriales archaeon QS_8_69_26]|nr:MAG: AAA family ATPase [Halobacteriales archaeon QS_8_69_26]